MKISYMKNKCIIIINRDIKHAKITCFAHVKQILIISLLLFLLSLAVNECPMSALLSCTIHVI